MKKRKKRVSKKVFGNLARLDTATLLYLLAGVIFLFGLISLGWFLSGEEETITSTNTDGVGEVVEEEDECENRIPLNGVCVEAQEKTAFPLVGIMVENHIHAQPLSGISQASVVYEAPVEGSIPRLLAFYPTDAEVTKVGPVRSARPYYLDWLAEYGDAMYMHVGGSPEALDKIEATGVFDMNEFSRGWYYWRSDDRRAPHNAYTSSKLWQAAQEKYAPKNQELTFDAWVFGHMEPCDQECVSEIRLSFGGGVYDPTWTFNSSTQQFDRSQFGRAHRDQNGERIVADTVVVQYVNARVTDNVGRLAIDTIGNGTGVVFRNGHAIPAVWEKQERESRTTWIDTDGNPIPFNAGKIWVEVVSQYNSAEFE